MEKILTIAIPSYNVQRYLSGILNSFLMNKLKNQLEILVINDGSKDETLKIGYEYSKKYPDIIKVIDKKNGGHGSAINSGIEHATGKFFKLVDADDWLDNNGLYEVLLKLEKLNNIDMVICPMIEYNDKTKRKKVISNIGQKSLINGRVYNAENALISIPPMHSIIYCTNILKQNFEKIRIDENRFYVDVEYILFPFLYVQNLLFLTTPLYVYRVNVAGQSTSVKSLVRNKVQHHDVLIHINKYVRDNVTVDNEKYKIMVTRVSQMIAAHYKIILLQEISGGTLRELKTFEHEVEQNFLFNKNSINLPIRILLSTNLILFPVLHFMAILKAKLQ